jgi:2,4-dienoyl-CoA reductase-like NADH-dependent reductase (Old Yellow Enzyme family)
MRAEMGSLEPRDMMIEYYKQRASDGGLLITEVSPGAPGPTRAMLTFILQATYPFKEASGYPVTPGNFTPEHIKKWKGITDAVHSKGARIFVQLWMLGRSNPGETDVEVVGASDIPLPSKEGEAPNPTPRPLTTKEVGQYVEKYAQGCKYAMEAGFDGVEIHAARELLG